MKAARFNRLINPQTQRCIDVAIDYDFFNEASFLPGIENLLRAVETLVEAAPDAIQLILGQARHLQQLPVRGKPALIPEPEIFACTQGVLAQRMAGIVCGRNIIQHANPRAITLALMAVVHAALPLKLR